MFSLLCVVFMAADCSDELQSEVSRSGVQIATAVVQTDLSGPVPLQRKNAGVFTILKFTFKI